MFDRDKLARALHALVDNALTYSPPRSRVAVVAAGDRDAVRIEVCDEGIGIPAHERSRLVEPFERGSHPEQPVAGRGLGLALARTVAHAHGGDLVLADRPPTGLSATLVLPREGPAPGPTSG